MFQDPQGTSVKAREFPLWSLCAPSPSVLCCRLAPPPSFLRVGFSLCWCLRPAPAAPPVLLPRGFVLPMPLWLCVPVCSPKCCCCWGTEVLDTPLTALSSVVYCLCLLNSFCVFSGAAMSLPLFRGFSLPPFLCGCLFVCLLARRFVGSSLSFVVWGGRTLTGAMDWTALQRASLALSSWALCCSVQSAREQQSLQTWFVRCGCAAVFLQMVHSVGEWPLARMILLPPWRLQHALQILQGRWRPGIFEQFCLAPALRTLLASPVLISSKSAIGYWWYRLCDRHRFRCPSLYILRHDHACEPLRSRNFHTVGTVNLEFGGASNASRSWPWPVASIWRWWRPLMLSTLAASLSSRCNQPPILGVGVPNHCGSTATATEVQHLLQSQAWYRMTNDGSSVVSGRWLSLVLPCYPLSFSR